MRSATAGATEIARRAGTSVAASAASSSVATTPASTSGSLGPGIDQRARTDPKATLNAEPMTNPAATAMTSDYMAERNTARGDAPSVMRMPNSRVRCAIE